MSMGNGRGRALLEVSSSMLHKNPDTLEDLKKPKKSSPPPPKNEPGENLGDCYLSCGILLGVWVCGSFHFLFHSPKIRKGIVCEGLHILDPRCPKPLTLNPKPHHMKVPRPPRRCSGMGCSLDFQIVKGLGLFPALARV